MTTGQAIPIYEGQDFYVPHFEIKLRGRPLDRTVVRDIISVTYSDNVEEMDRFEITINNWDEERRTFKYIDQDIFDPGKEAEVWMGYYGQDSLRLMLTGEITSLRPAFPAGGPPTLAVSGLNILHRFRTEQRSAVYENKKDSQIAREIGGVLGLQVRTDSNAEAGEEALPYLLQYNEYDVVFLLKRARRLGYDLFVEEVFQNGQSAGNRLYFGPSVNVKKVTYRLEWGRSLIEFNPTLTTADQVGEVTVRGWDPVGKKKIEVTVKRSELEVRAPGTEQQRQAVEQSFSQRKEVIASKPVHSEQEARTLAKETLQRIAKDLVKGSGSTVGLPDLRAGNVVEIQGLGQRFSGNYFVTGTSHSIGGSGYTTSFECRLEDQ